MSQRVYGTHSGRPSVDGRRWIALLSAPPGSVLDHVSVCNLVGLDEQVPGPIHVLRKGAAWDAPKGVVAHKTIWLPNSDVTATRGIPHATVARALIDAAVDVEQNYLDDLLDTAVRKKIYNADDVLRVLSDRPRFAGARRLIAAVARLDSLSGTFLSNFERRTTRLIGTSTRIPAPEVNVLVKGFRPDLRIPGTRAIIECDGRDYHRSPAQIAADEQREAILRQMGFVFLRLRWDQLVYEEARTLRRIEEFVLANLAPPTPR